MYIYKTSVDKYSILNVITQLDMLAIRIIVLCMQRGPLVLTGKSLIKNVEVTVFNYISPSITWVQTRHLNRYLSTLTSRVCRCFSVFAFCLYSCSRHFDDCGRRIVNSAVEKRRRDGVHTHFIRLGFQSALHKTRTTKFDSMLYKTLLSHDNLIYWSLNVCVIAEFVMSCVWLE